jgi:hypothetical protein
LQQAFLQLAFVCKQKEEKVSGLAAKYRQFIETTCFWIESALCSGSSGLCVSNVKAKECGILGSFWAWKNLVLNVVKSLDFWSETEVYGLQKTGKSFNSWFLKRDRSLWSSKDGKIFQFLTF